MAVTAEQIIHAADQINIQSLRITGQKRRIFALALFIPLLLSGCAEPLYYTSDKPLGDQQNPLTDSSHVFIAPYFAELNNEVVVSILPSSSQKGDTGHSIGGVADPAADGAASPPPPPPTILVTVVPIPVSRAYLYMTKNSLFTNSANIGIGADGLLTSSDTSSSQQVTAILTELAQTAAPLAQGAFGFRMGPTLGNLEKTNKRCWDSIKELTDTGPFYRELGSIQRPYDQQKLAAIASDTLNYSVYADELVYKDEVRRLEVHLQLAVPGDVINEQEASPKGGHDGLIVFFPVPTVARLTCIVDNQKIDLTAPSVLNLYLTSYFLDPKRDFLTSPQDTYTFNEGFITGHKFSNQSPVKTVVDTITSPIRAIMPSVQVTTTSQVQTGGGKPEQTTNTTATQVSPQKASLQ